MNTVPETIDTPAILIDREVLARNIAAEVFAGHGATDIFIAHPLWIDARKAERLRFALHRRHTPAAR